MNKYQIGILGIVLLVVIYLQFGLDQKTTLILMIGLAFIILAGDKKKG